MPKIPMDLPQASMNVPGLNAPQTRQFGKIGEAVEGLGQTVESNSIEIHNQIMAAEAQTTALTQYSQDKMDSEQKMIALKAQSPDGYMHNDDGSVQMMPDGTTPKDITQGYHEWANDRFQQSQQNMPNDMARMAYTQKALPYMSDATGQMIVDTQQAKIAQATNARNQNVQDIGDDLASNPSLMNLYGHAADIKAMGDVFVQSGLWNATQGAEQQRSDFQKISSDTLRGAYTDIYSERKQGGGDTEITDRVLGWLDRIRGDDPISKAQAAAGAPTLSTMLNPEQKAAETNNLIGLLPGAKASDDAYFRHRVQGVIAGNKKGLGSEDETNGTLQALVDYKGDLTKVDRLELGSELVASRYTGFAHGPAYVLTTPGGRAMLDAGVVKSVQTKIQDFEQKLGYEPTQEEGRIVGIQAQQSILESKNKIETGLKSDSAAMFAGNTDDSDRSPILPAYGKALALAKTVSPIAMGQSANAAAFQAGLQTLKTAAKTSLGPDFNADYRPIDRDLSKSWGDWLQGKPRTSDNFAPNATQQAQAARSIMKATGADFGPTVQTMINDGSLGKQYVLMGINKSVVGSTALMSSLSGGTDNMALFDQNHVKDPSVNKDLLMQAVTKQTQGLTNYVVDKNSGAKPDTEYATQINKVIADRAAALFQQNRGSSADDMDKAVSDAYHEFVGDHVYQEDPNKGFTLSPKQGFYNSGLANPPVVPKEWGTPAQQTAAMGYLKNSLTPDALKAMGAVESPLSGHPLLGDQFYKSITNPENHPRFISVEDPVKGRGFNLKVEVGPNHDPTIIQQGTAVHHAPLFIPWNKANSLVPGRKPSSIMLEDGTMQGAPTIGQKFAANDPNEGSSFEGVETASDSDLNHPSIEDMASLGSAKESTKASDTESGKKSHIEVGTSIRNGRKGISINQVFDP